MNIQNNAHARARLARAGGFSLIELLVSVAVGLLALSFATRMVGQSEQHKQGTLGGSDSMQNGVLAMFSISSDAAQAGWGINDRLIAGCDTAFADTEGFQLAQTQRGGVAVRPLTAAIIEANGSAPDRISLYSGSSISGTGSLRLVDDFAGGSRISVDRVPYGFARGDVIAIAPETVGESRCTLAQVSNDPGALAAPPQTQYLEVAGGAGLRFGPGAGAVSFKASKARLFNLGPGRDLAFHTWSVQNGFLQLRSSNLEGAAETPSTVADNIVSIKAQYGFAAPVPQWSSAMIDADGDGIVGSAGDFQSVTLLRLAVVARARAPERPSPGTNCSATGARPVLFASAMPAGMASEPVTVDVAVAGDSVDWRCYRYRVFETIVPLKNAMWKPIA